MSTRGPVAVVSTTISRTVDQFYRETMLTLQQEGYAVHVITTDGPEVPALRERAEAVHLVRMERTISPWADLRALIDWVNVLRNLRPDVVLAGTPKAGLLGMVAARLVRVPHRAYFLQGLRLEGTIGIEHKVLAAMEWLTSWCSQVVIAVSPSLARRYRELRLSAGRPMVVPHHGSSHGVNTEHFTPIARAENVLADAGLDPLLPVIAFIGRLTRDKGPDALIAAVREIIGRGEKVQLLVLGAQDEADSTSYLEQLRNSGLPVAVWAHLEDVRPFLSVTDILVLPTWREGMPNVVLEAAAVGVPTITTNATGAVDSVQDGVTGLIVPVNDAPKLANAIDRLLKDPRLRRDMGYAARARVVEDFQPNDVAASVIAAALGRPPLSTVPESGPLRDCG